MHDGLPLTMRTTPALALIKPFLAIHGGMKLRTLQALLQVAGNPGLTVNEYAIKSGVELSSMSRNLLELADRSRRQGGAGHGLIEARNGEDLRERRYYLTPAGHRLVARAMRLERGKPEKGWA
jgi:DNA-binding MarR family transcriptional regulator